MNSSTSHKTVVLPQSINIELREQIRVTYISAVEKADQADAVYVDGKIDRVVRRLLQQDSYWLKRLGATAGALQEARSGLHRPPQTSDVDDKYILAALFYLCNPFDIIPDHTPGTGYLDDALVVDICVKYLKKANPSLYEWIDRRSHALVRPKH